MRSNYWKLHRGGLALLLVLATAGASDGVLADPATGPAGLWKTVDDRTGADRSIVRIENDGKHWSGRVVKSLDARDDPKATCRKCPGDRKDQPIVGMTILTGLTRSANDARLWEGGEILDPDSGGLYRARMRLSEDGRTLEVRGFLGVSLFGRTQVWQRAE
jgi:uncharacterized protein (DUF2147 family)